MQSYQTPLIEIVNNSFEVFKQLFYIVSGGFSFVYTLIWKYTEKKN